LVNRGTMGVNSLPKTVTRQRRGCDLNPGPSAPESSTLTTRLSIGGGVIRQKQSVCCICNDVGWAEYRAAADLRKQIVIRCSFQHRESRPATLNAARRCGYKFTQHQLNVSCSNRCKGSETRSGSRAAFKCVEALGRIIIRGPYPPSNAIIYMHLQL